MYVDVAPFKPVSYKGRVRMGRRRGRVSFQTAVSGSLVRLAQEEGPEWAGPTPPHPAVAGTRRTRRGSALAEGEGKGEVSGASVNAGGWPRLARVQTPAEVAVSLPGSPYLFSI